MNLFLIFFGFLTCSFCKYLINYVEKRVGLMTQFFNLSSIRELYSGVIDQRCKKKKNTTSLIDAYFREQRAEKRQQEMEGLKIDGEKQKNGLSLIVGYTENNER